MGDQLIGEHRAEVFAFAASARLPATLRSPELAQGRRLVAYGPLLAEHYVMGAGYVDRFSRAPSPPTARRTTDEIRARHQFKTAKALGLTIPQSLLVRATR